MFLASRPLLFPIPLCYPFITGSRQSRIHKNNIKTLAEKSAWIGNDEAHYIRKQEERTVSDLKKFILASTYFISMTLTTEDAASILPL